MKARAAEENHPDCSLLRQQILCTPQDY